MEYEIDDDPQGEPCGPEGERDGGIYDDEQEVQDESQMGEIETGNG